MTTDPEAPAAALPGAGAAAARGGALRSVGFAVSAALSLATLPLMIRHLGVADFGRWVAVLALVNVVGLAAELGLNTLALREYPLLAAAERQALLGSVLGLRLVLVALGTVVALVFALAAGWSGTMVAGVLIASVALWAGSLQELQVVRLSGELRYGAVTAMEVGRAAATAAAVLALVVGGAGLLPFFGVYIAGTVVAVAVGGVVLRGSERVLPRLRRADWRRLWADAAVYAAATAVYVVYFRVVLLITSIVASAVETGYFATAFRVTEFAVAVPGVLAATVLPVLAHAARHDRPRFEQLTGDLVRIGLVAGAAAALGLAFAAPAVMDVLGGSDAEPAVAVLRIQAAAVATSFFAFGTGAALFALRRQRALLVVNVIALACVCVLAVVLADAHGARGAAAATVAGECVLVIGQVLALRSHVSLGRQVSLGRATRAAAIVAVAAGAAIGLFIALPFPDIPATILALVLYAAIVLTDRDVRGIIRRARSPRDL